MQSLPTGNKIVPKRILVIRVGEPGRDADNGDIALMDFLYRQILYANGAIKMIDGPVVFFLSYP
jgi:hypothetical protein